ncbi:MAG: lipopolysaccharide transport system permease protein [Actinomycetota bacterium]|nr:lipopolysaccharide transport system permease protein [Actinomycetota bacterium]
MIAGVEELFRARELTGNLVRRDLKVRHRGTFLGMLWSLTTPLLFVGLYWFIFTFIFRARDIQDATRTDGTVVPFALYFFGGLVIWNLFATAVGGSTGAVTGSGYLLGKVYFPRAILPLATVLSSVVTFGFELAVLVVATLIFAGLPSLQLLWLPLIVLVVTVLSFGLALILSAVNVFLRDVAHFINVFLQLWFWGTPIIYSLSLVKDRPGLVRLLEANPVTGIVVSFRNVVLLNRPPDLGLLAYDALVAVVLLVLGAVLFGRWQSQFAEIV